MEVETRVTLLAALATCSLRFAIKVLKVKDESKSIPRYVYVFLSSAIFFAFLETMNTPHLRLFSHPVSRTPTFRHANCSDNILSL